MIYNPEKHHRRSIRLKGYDYRQAGTYFVTVCIQERQCLLGEIINGEMELNAAGQMIQKNWISLTKRFIFVIIDEYIIMPNHLHGIIILRKDVGASLVDAQHNNQIIKPLKTVRKTNQNNTNNNVYSDVKRADKRPAPKNAGFDNVIGSFKSITTNEYIKGIRNSKWLPFNKRLWQRNYYEHIIRDDKELNRIRKYIIENPLNWDMDKNYPRIWNKIT